MSLLPPEYARGVGETAAGKHPVQAVEAMAGIAACTEASIHYDRRFARIQVIA